MRSAEVSQWRRIATPVALAIVSLVAALALWIAVTDAENPQTTGEFPGAIEVKAVNVPEGFAVKSIAPSTITVEVRTDADKFDELTTADFQAEVNLTGVRESTTDQDVIVHIVGSIDAQVVRAGPQFVTVTLEPSATKEVPVVANLVGSLPQGVGLDSVASDPPVVQVTGPSSRIELIDSAVADVNVTGLRNNLDQQISLTARDARGSDFRGIFIEPASARIKVTVSVQQITTPLPVTAVIQGAVAEGYNILSITVDPQTVTGAGSLNVLQSVTAVSTEAIDINGQREDVERTVKLQTPAGVELNRESVTVKVNIEPAQGEIIQVVAPQVTDLPDGLTATLQTTSITVLVSGDVPTLRSLAVGAIEAKVSAEGLEAGSHVLTPTITVPEGLQLVTSDPRQVVLILN